METAESVLRDMGERGDILKAMLRALDASGLGEARATWQLAVHGKTLRERITGRVLAKELATDELGDRVQLILDATDGRVHQVEASASTNDEVRPGMIVSISPPLTQPRSVDRNTATAADDQGHYAPPRHLERIKGQSLSVEPERFVKAHVRRLEALRRAGLVERLDADISSIPKDLPERGLDYDRKRYGRDPRVEIVSPIGLERQLTHDGATWLDRELMAQVRTPLAHTGFGAEVAGALERRKHTLVELGMAAETEPGRLRAPRDLIARLERREVDRVGKALAAKRGLEWRPIRPGGHVEGKLVGSTRLASGRYAMVDDGLGFSLVPWNDVLQRQIGRAVSGIARPGGGVDWTLGRQRGLSF